MLSTHHRTVPLTSPSAQWNEVPLNVSLHQFLLPCPETMRLGYRCHIQKKIWPSFSKNSSPISIFFIVHQVILHFSRFVLCHPVLSRMCFICIYFFPMLSFFPSPLWKVSPSCHSIQFTYTWFGSTNNTVPISSAISPNGLIFNNLH